MAEERPYSAPEEDAGAVTPGESSPPSGAEPGDRAAAGRRVDSAAGTVATGILISRVAGFIRERVLAHFFGVGAHSDVISVAFRAPNLLQNLLGEGTMSAAFIPIYSRMLAEGRRDEAGRFAGAILGLLLAVAAALSLLGFLFAEFLVTIFAPGFLQESAEVVAGERNVDRYSLAVQAVRYVFPMTGLLVLSAWCLGVLNSHRRFFLSYFAPVLWNVAIIAALYLTGSYVLDTDILSVDALSEADGTRLLMATFIGALIGGFLQFAVQLPLVFRLLRGFRLTISLKVRGVRAALLAFGPVVAARGVYQLSAYLDTFLASWLDDGALAALRFALMLYVLPVSLFGLSVAASELPELSRLTGEQIDGFLERISRSLSQMLFMTIPTAVGYVLFGYLIIGALFQSGEFADNATWLVYLVLVGYTLGLLATTMSRLLQNSFYAINDTKTPAKIAVARVVISALIAVPSMLFLDQFALFEVLGLPATGEPLFLGAVGLALGASVGSWIELWRLKRALSRRIESFRLPWRSSGIMLLIALGAAVPAGFLWWLLPAWHVALVAGLVLPVYAGAYLAISRLSGSPEIQAWSGRVRDRMK